MLLLLFLPWFLHCCAATSSISVVIFLYSVFIASSYYLACFLALFLDFFLNFQKKKKTKRQRKPNNIWPSFIFRARKRRGLFVNEDDESVCRQQSMAEIRCKLFFFRVRGLLGAKMVPGVLVFSVLLLLNTNLRDLVKY